MEKVEQDEMKHRAKYLTDVPYLKHMTFDQRKNICQGSKY